MRDSEFCARLEIEITVLRVWMDQQWLVPEEEEGVRVFQEADLARGRLILDLLGPMGLNPEGVDVAMSLIDQIHSLRGRLNEIVTAIRSQDRQVQAQILSRFEKM